MTTFLEKAIEKIFGLSSDKKDKSKYLKVYVPRFESKKLKLDKNEYWESDKSGALFFETFSYGCYSDSSWFKKPLNILIRKTSSTKIGLKIRHAEFKNNPGCFEEAEFQNGNMKGIFTFKKINEVMTLYEKANWGQWTFYGLKAGRRNMGDFFDFPEILPNYRKFRFVIENDLDSGLFGITAFQNKKSNPLISMLRNIK